VPSDIPAQSSLRSLSPMEPIIFDVHSLLNWPADGALQKPWQGVRREIQ